MRFSLLLSAFAASTASLASGFNTRSGVTPFSNTLFGRQAVGVNLCLTVQPTNVGVNVPVLGEVVTVGTSEPLCLCLANGLLTPDSLDRLSVSLANGAPIEVTLLDGTIILDLLDVISLDVLTTLVGDSLLTLLGDSPTPDQQCTYGTGAIPNSCTACTYDCPAETPTDCNGDCLATSVCPSSLPQRRRARSVNADLLCPTGLTACSLSSKLGGLWGKVECLDTLHNVEACGGCEVPLPGMKRGVDCTAITHTNEVSCVAGQCVVGSCLDGFSLVGNACVAAGFVKQY